jgi:hypothetical protein
VNKLDPGGHETEAASQAGGEVAKEAGAAEKAVTKGKADWRCRGETPFAVKLSKSRSTDVKAGGPI